MYSQTTVISLEKIICKFLSHAFKFSAAWGDTVKASNGNFLF